MPTGLIREMRKLLRPVEPPERTPEMRPLASCGNIPLEVGRPMGAGGVGVKYYHARIEKGRLPELKRLVSDFKAPEGFQLTVFEMGPPGPFAGLFKRERLVRIAIQYRTKTVTSQAISDAWHGRSETT